MQKPKMSKEMRQQMNKECMSKCLPLLCLLGLSYLVWIWMITQGMISDETMVIWIGIICFEGICLIIGISKVQQEWFAKAREENETEQKKVSQSTDIGKPQGSLRQYRFEMHSADSQPERAFCPFCGNKITVKSALYCEQCGKKM